MYGSSIKVISTAVMHYSACLNRQMTSTSYKRIGFAGGGEEGIPRHIVVILLRELIHGWRRGGGWDWTNLIISKSADAYQSHVLIKSLSQFLLGYSIYNSHVPCPWVLESIAQTVFWRKIQKNYANCVF